MSATDFFDTNVALYLLSADTAKADRAEALLAEGGHVSVQVLNEFANVASRKLQMPWTEIEEVLQGLCTLCEVHPLTLETHSLGLSMAKRHGFPLYDAMIVASALLAGCKTLYSEDFQDGMKVGDSLTISNPFL